MTTKRLNTWIILVAGLAGGWALTALFAQETKTSIPVGEIVASATATNSESPLQTLDWLVGSWTGKAENGTIEFSCHFTKNNAFLIRSFRILDGANVKMSGMQVIAWDPTQQTIRSWTYDSDGGFGEDTWTQANDRYTMRAKYTLPDGGTGSALHAMRYIDENTFVWKSTNREIDGELLPDSAEIVISRVATTAAAASAPRTEGGTK